MKMPKPEKKFIIFFIFFSGHRKITCVVYWPGQTCHSKDGRSCVFHWRGRAWLTIWDRVKIPRYSHKLMHRKRVTCELHDSYFRSMTIKHTIPKTAEVHIPMASYGNRWRRALNYYITQCTWNSRGFGDQTSWRRDAVEKASTQQMEPSGPRLWVWGSDELEIRCSRENQHPERLSSPGERERNADGHKSGGSICCSSIRSPTPSHTQPFRIKWEVDFSKELCRSSLLCRRYDSACRCICICIVCLYSWSWL